MQEDFTINDSRIKAGMYKTVMLPMPKLYDWTPMHMPIHVFHGKSPGSTLCVTAAIHGDELNGVEIIRRLLKKSIIKKLNGTLIAVPIVNTYGFLYKDRYLLDRRDLNRSFPGSESGSLAARMANLIMKQLLDKSTHFIDLHSGSMHRFNLPQIRGNLNDKTVENLAMAFNAPAALHSKERDGSLRQAATEKGIPFLLYECGEALRFDEFSIRVGVNGIINVMENLNMLPSGKKKKNGNPCSITYSSYWVRAQHSGIIRPFKTLGARVKKDEVLGTIYNPIGKEKHLVTAKEPGIIIAKNNLPLIHEGAAVFHIACFEKLKQAAKGMENIQYIYDDEANLDDSLFTDS